MKELEKENTRLKRLVAELSLEKQVLKGWGLGKLLSPERRRCVVERAREQYGLTERQACRLVDGAVARDTAIRALAAQRRGCVDPGHRQLGQ